MNPCKRKTFVAFGNKINRKQNRQPSRQLDIPHVNLMIISLAFRLFFDQKHQENLEKLDYHYLLVDFLRMCSLIFSHLSKTFSKCSYLPPSRKLTMQMTARKKKQYKRQTEVTSLVVPITTKNSTSTWIANREVARVRFKNLFLLSLTMMFDFAITSRYLVAVCVCVDTSFAMQINIKDQVCMELFWSEKTKIFFSGVQEKVVASYWKGRWVFWWHQWKIWTYQFEINVCGVESVQTLLIMCVCVWGRAGFLKLWNERGSGSTPWNMRGLLQNGRN